MASLKSTQPYSRRANSIGCPEKAKEAYESN